MDRNREARRAAAMANGLHRRRHRTTTNSGSLRDYTEDDGPLELHETARLRDRTVKKDRDRELRDRDRDRDRDRERERLSRSKRRRSENKYGSIREDGGGGGGGNGGAGVDDSSEESIDDEFDDDDDGPVRYTPLTNSVPMSTSSPASTLTSHRKSYPPPSKVYRVAPTWKAPDEMIGFSVPRKARSASTKRSHDWTSGGGVTIDLQASSSPVRSSMTASAAAVETMAAPITAAPPPSHHRPISPSSSNVSIKKNIKANGLKNRPPKSLSTKSPPSVQDEIEIEVAEVLYGLMRQSQTPSSKQEHPPPHMSNDSAVKFDSRSAGDSKSRVSSPITNSPSVPLGHSTAAPLVTVATKRKRPRPCPDDIPAGFGRRSSPKVEPDQPLKPEPTEKNNEGSFTNKGGSVPNAHDTASTELKPVLNSSNGVLSLSSSSVDAKAASLVVEESGGERNRMVRGSTDTKVEVEASSSSAKLESSLIYDRAESSSTSAKPNPVPLEKEKRRDEKFEIDLMVPASPGKEEMAEYGGGTGDEKPIVTVMEAASKSNAKGVDHKGSVEAVKAAANRSGPHKSITAVQQHQHQINLNGKESNTGLQLDWEKVGSVKDNKLSFQQQLSSKTSLDEAHAHSDKTGGQSSSVPFPMSVPAGWHGGLAPMGYVGPLQRVVSIDGTTMVSPPIQPPPHSLFPQPRPKRCATHWYIARSISVHQQVMKMNPFWPAAAAGTAPLFGAKPPYNLNMVPSADMHAGRGLINSGQDNKGQPFAFFPGHGQPLVSSIDESAQAVNVPDSAQKKQFLLQPGLPPGAPSNIMHAPALFFPMGQQQAPPSARPSSGNSPSSAGGAALTSTSCSAPMGAAVSNAPPAGPGMSFSYPNMGGNETQFMAILGNGAYPFPIPAHVGAAPPYRGSHPQAMSFFNGSFYSSQMLHPSQLQQQHQHPGPSSESLQIQQQSHQNDSISTASSPSQKHLQNQQQRPQGSSANATGIPNQNPVLQNFQGTKGREMGGENSPSTAGSHNRPNLSFCGPNYAMPFQGPNFALMPSSLGGSCISAGFPNGNHAEQKQLQQAQQPALNTSFPMSFTNINGATTSAFDISSMANSHANLQSLPDSAKLNYQMMAAAAQAAQQRKNDFRGLQDGKSGAGTASDTTSLEEERKAMGARASAASVGQSIAFSRDLAENSVVDSSARSRNLVPESTLPARSSGPNATAISSNSQQQQYQSQMLFPKQQYAPSSAANGRSKTPTINGSVYADHVSSSSIMAAKFPNSLPGLPSLVQTSGTLIQSPQWKNGIRPNTSPMNSPSIAGSTPASNMKIASQQQGRSQQNHTHISFGAGVPNSKPSPVSQGQQTQNSSQTPSSPMMAGSPSSSSISKSAGGSPRTSASASAGNKSVAQVSTLSSHQGRNSPSPSMTNQKPSNLGSSHIMSTCSTSKLQLQQQPQQQPPLSKQSIQQAQLYFSNSMQASANTSPAMAGAGYYLQRQRPDSQQQLQQGLKLQGPTPSTSSSGMLSLCTPVSSTSDPAKAVAAAAAAASNMKGGLPSQGMFNAAQFAGQSTGGTNQLMPPSFPCIHAVSAGVQVKPAEQKQPAGE